MCVSSKCGMEEENEDGDTRQALPLTIATSLNPTGVICGSCCNAVIMQSGREAGPSQEQHVISR